MATLLIGLVPASAMAQASSDTRETAKLTVDVSAQRFVAKGDRVLARGPVVAEVVREDGSVERLEQRVSLRVKPTKNCQILELDLARLYLNLLGLEVRTSEIHVRITGRSKQVLGKLFCNLSEGLKLDKDLLAKKSARSLNKELAGRPLPVLSIRAPIHEQQQTSSRAKPGGGGKGGNGGNGGAGVPPVPPGSCEVLDILVGPLHLNLLGLVVDLYGPGRNEPVQVLVTSNPNGGALGSTFCELAGPYQPA